MKVHQPSKIFDKSHAFKLSNLFIEIKFVNISILCLFVVKRECWAQVKHV